MFIVKLIGRILLIPVWILLLIAWALVAAIVNIYGLIKGFATLFLGLILIGWLIWYRHLPTGYLILAIAEGILLTILFAGSFVQVILEEARRSIGNIIVYG